MKVVILCGGKGTRIRDVSADVPKPMVPVGQFPILWHIMQNYAAQGFSEFVLCLGHKGHVIKEFFLNYRALTSDFTLDFTDGAAPVFHDKAPQIDWKISFIDTGEETLTGSRVAKIRHAIGADERFMLTYGDGLSDVDLKDLEAFHQAHGRTMTVTGVRPPGRFGELEAGDDGRISEFNEKPQASGGRISGGFFVCESALFDYLDPERDDETLEAEPMRRLAREGHMMMYRHDGFWQCMDTRRDHQYLEDLYRSGQAPWVR